MWYLSILSRYVWVEALLLNKVLIEIKPKLACWGIFDFVLIHLVGSVTFELNFKLNINLNYLVGVFSILS